MSYIEYPLVDGYINRFMATDVFEEPKRFTKAVLQGRVNEWLKKGFAIHENPCRKAFVDSRLGITPEIPAEINFKRMVFPFGNIGMEASGFYFVPTYLRSYSTVTIHSSKAEQYAFSLETCGAVTLWVNGQLITDFTPFTRNAVKSTILEVDLKAGDNDFLICLEDLAERDADYYFRLRCLCNADKLSMRLPTDENVCAKTLNQMEAMLSDIHFDREVYIDEPGRLNIKNPFDFNLDLQIKIHTSHAVSRLAGPQPPKHQTHVLSSGQTFLSILPSWMGYCGFHIICEYQGISVSRVIGGQFVSSKLLNLNEPALDKRKAHMIDLVAQSEIENVFLACAILHQNGDVAKAEAIIFAELSGILLKKDCSDFHFAMLLHIYIAYGERLSAKVKTAIEDAMLGYRYWIDEPGDDVMWFFSENHALMFHVCQYIAGGILPDRIFEASGMRGEACRAKAEKLLETWFDAFFEEFITEWNSPAYIPVDFLGIAVLYMHGDETWREKSKAAMDKLSYCLATCAHDGALMTTAGRTYEKELKGVYGAGTTGLLHLLYNTGSTCRVDFALPLALSDYAPPSEYMQWIHPTDEALIRKTTQGFENHVNTYLYKDAYGILSTAVDFKPFEKGYQEHIVHCALDKTAQVCVNHPGEVHHFGTGRPSFWAGNGVLPKASQDGDTARLQYDLGDSRIGYTHAYIPLMEFDKHIISPKIVVVQKGKGLIGIKAENGLEQICSGPCAGREFISHGQKNTWTVKLGNLEQYADLEAFLQYIEEM